MDLKIINQAHEDSLYPTSKIWMAKTRMVGLQTALAFSSLELLVKRVQLYQITKVLTTGRPMAPGSSSQVLRAKPAA
jgi:hypothetical protein